MTITKRLITAAAQIIGATLAGYIAAFATIMLITPIFAAGLMVAAGIGGVVVWGIGRLFRMRGTLEMALIGAGVGAAVGYVILLTGAARDNLTLYLVLALIPGTLATVAYQWSDARNSHPTLS